MAVVVARDQPAGGRGANLHARSARSAPRPRSPSRRSERADARTVRIRSPSWPIRAPVPTTIRPVRGGPARRPPLL